MNIQEIKEALQHIAENFRKEEFIYDLLLSYGISKTSITRLKKGDFNLSKVESEVLYKGKVFYKAVATTELLVSLEEAAKDARILKQKPRFVIITDFETIVARDLKRRRNADFKIGELPKYAEFFQPLTGAEAYKAGNDNKADREAAYKLAELYEILVTDNPDYTTESHQLNVFLSRLLFCFFAEDTGIFEQTSLFTETLVRYTADDGKDVHTFLNSLFRRLNTEKGSFAEHLQAFPYVNGDLFRKDITSPKFSAKSRNILIECGELDWADINPDIFGSMIQAVADPEERSHLGMHYTSVPNILKLIGPLFLDELKAEAEKGADNPAALKKLMDRLGAIKFFDPACGSGNFLIITYKELRLLEIGIIQRLIVLEEEQSAATYQGKLYTAKPLDGTQARLNMAPRNLFVTQVSLSQFYGIEIKDFAHEMAILSLWLAEHQMNKVFDDRLEGYGQSKPILPLKEAGQITLGNAARLPWEVACPKEKEDEIYVLGNPPYLGARMQDELQKADVGFVLRKFSGFNNMDYISSWFFKAKEYIQGCNAKCAFVSTNSVCQGEQVSLLWPNILNGAVEIGFAQHSFKWTNNAKGAAGVTVIILSLRNKSAEPKYLYNETAWKPAKNINAYLIDYKDIYVLPRTKPLSNIPDMNFGSMANDGGHLFLSPDEREKFIEKDKRCTRLIKKLVGSLEFIRGVDKYCLWIDDSQEVVAKTIPIVNERIELTRKSRLKSKRGSTQTLADEPYKFGEIRHRNTDAIFVPSVSSEKRDYIPIGFLTNDSIIVAPNFAIYDAQPWLFGILHSKMHMVWVDAVGGKLKTDYRYSAKLVYNTFPFPDITTKQKETINQYVYAVLDERAKYPQKTMAWLYNPDTMPAGLRGAHKDLDAAIEAIYRQGNPFSNDAERLEHLFKLYEEMTQRDTIFAKVKKTRKAAKR